MRLRHRALYALRDRWLRLPGVTQLYRGVGYFASRRWRRAIAGSLDVDAASGQRVTVLVPHFHPQRVLYLESLCQAVLKCRFVQRLVISNHNPDTRIEEWVGIEDPRLVLMNQVERRGCGYIWELAERLEGEFFIVIDDDILIYPQQLASLFNRLVEDPSVPHGIVGRRSDGVYIKNRECEAAVLYNLYAVTRAHLERYVMWRNEILGNGWCSAEAVDFWADDILISQTGSTLPRIHKLGSVLSAPTAHAPGVATYLENGFRAGRREVRQALRRLDKGPVAGNEMAEPEAARLEAAVTRH